MIVTSALKTAQSIQQHDLHRFLRYETIVGFDEINDLLNDDVKMLLDLVASMLSLSPSFMQKTDVVALLSHETI